MFNAFYDNYYKKAVYNKCIAISLINQVTQNDLSFIKSCEHIFKNRIYKIAMKTLLCDFQSRYSKIYPENQSRNLTDYLSSNEIKSLQKRYSRLTALLEYCVKTTDKFLYQINSDIAQELKRIQLYTKESIESITICDTGSDTHNGGKTVIEIKFNKRFSFFYKENGLDSLRALMAVSSILQHDERLDISMTDVIPLQNGYLVKKIESENIETWKFPIDYQNYYKTFGSLAAILYVLNATDMHFENILMSHKTPQVGDVENLFSNLSHFEQTNHYLFQHFENTILSTYLFDYSYTPYEDAFSFIGGTSNPKYNLDLEEVIVDENTDKMRIIQKERETVSHNIPKYKKNSVEVFEFENAFLKGFKEAYLSFLKNKKRLKKLVTKNLGENSKIRVLIRPTYVYSAYSEALRQPQNFNYGDILSILTKNQIVTSKIGAVEFRELSNLDIPYFFTKWNSRDLFAISTTGFPQQVEPNYFSETSASMFNRKIEGLSYDDLNYELKVISMAIAGYKENVSEITNKYTYKQNHVSLTTEILHQNNRSKDISSRVSEQLLKSIITNKNGAQCISLVLNKNGYLFPGYMGYGLYDGLDGLVVVLNGLYRGTQDLRRKKEIMERLSELLITSDRLWKLDYNSVSAFYGTASHLKCLYYVKDISALGKQLFYKDMPDLIKKLCKVDANKVPLDYLSGVAGVLSFLIDIYTEDEYCHLQLKNIINKLTKILLKRVVFDKNYFWTSDTDSNSIRSGLAHGITGIDVALSKLLGTDILTLAERTNISAIILSSLKEENHLFNFQEERWQISSNDSEIYGSLNSWCNGSVGMLLGRFVIHSFVQDPLVESFIENIKEKLIDEEPISCKDDSLCHGLSGAAAVLKYMSLNDKSFTNIYMRYYSALQKMINSERFVSGYYTQPKISGWSLFLSQLGVLQSLDYIKMNNKGISPFILL